MKPTSPEQGEGAQSLGVMIPIHEAQTVAEANQLADLLTDEAIPALVQSAARDHPGLLLPDSTSGGAWVVVPDKLRREAVAVLRQAQRSRFRQPHYLRALPVLPPSRPAATPPAAVVPPMVGLGGPIPEAELPDAHEVPLEPAPIEPSGAFGRFVIASGAILLASGLQRVLSLEVGQRALVDALGASREHVFEWWRLVTASFVHSSFSHHFSNAIFGLLIGVVLFGTHGVGATALTWLLASAVGLFTEVVASPHGALIIGASAGNYGLAGLWARGQLDRAEHLVLPRRERTKTLGILVLMLPGALTPFSSSGSRIAVLAHVAGFVAGFAAGYVFRRQLSLQDLAPIVQRSRRASWVAIGLTALSVIGALGHLVFRLW